MVCRKEGRPMPLAKRQWMMRLTLALWLLATFGSPSVGWGQPKYGGTLVMVHTDPDLMNPVATPGWLQFQRMSFNGLIDYDAQGNIVRASPRPGRFPKTA